MFRLTKKNAPKRKAVLDQDPDSSSDSDGQSFTLEMEQRAKKVSKLARQAEDDYVQEPEIEQKPKKTSSGVVENLHRAKAQRERDRAIAQQSIKEKALEKYLEQNKEAVVFNSDAYLTQRADKHALDDDEESDTKGSEFYAGLLKMRTGRDLGDLGISESQGGDLIQKVSEANAPITSTNTKTDTDQTRALGKPLVKKQKIERPQTEHGDSEVKDFIDTSYYSRLRVLVMEYMKLSLTKSDIEDARERYYERCQAHAKLID